MFNTSWRSSLINEKLEKELITTPERCGCVTSSPLSQKCKFNHSCTIYCSSTKYLCKPEVKLGCPISIWHIIWILLFTVVTGLFLMTKLGLLPHCRLDQTNAATICSLMQALWLPFTLSCFIYRTRPSTHPSTSKRLRNLCLQVRGGVLPGQVAVSSLRLTYRGKQPVTLTFTHRRSA